MLLKGLLKRFLPFAVALGIGLFVAGLFIGVAAPKVDSGKNEYEGRSCWKQKRMKHEDRLKREESRRERARNRYNQSEELENLVPPPAPLEPAVSR